MEAAEKDANEELSSDTDDEDYVPSGEGEQSDDVSADEEETNQRESDGDDSPKKPESRKRKQKKVRKEDRKRLATATGKVNTCSEKEALGQTEEQKAEEEKRKADDLWSSFLQDVGSSRKTVKTSTDQVHSKLSFPTTSSKPHKKPQVTVTKVFDFAGEQIRVSNTVDADSKEAKAQEKRKLQSDDAKSQEDSTVITSASSTSQPGKPGGLSSVLGFINRKNKMSTLDKSKLDWDSFKKEQSLEEELTLHNKSKKSFLERKAFLERTDLREFEIEKSIRQSQPSKR